jgi:hypothetical protein
LLTRPFIDRHIVEPSPRRASRRRAEKSETLGVFHVNWQATQHDLRCHGECRQYRGHVALVVKLNVGAVMPSLRSTIEAGKPTGFDRIAWESPG